MTPFTDRDRLAAFLANLETADKADHFDLFAQEVMEHGGTFPEHKPKKGERFLFDIQLHGINAKGGSVADALANWTSTARHTLRAWGDAA